MHLRILLPALAFLTLNSTSLTAQEATAPHRAVYEEVNAKEKSWQKIKAQHRDDPIVFELEGWSDAKGLRKIISQVPGEDGGGVEEYYLDSGKLLFVYRTYQTGGGDTKVPAKRIEDRFYFSKDGKLFQWLSSDKSTVLHAEDYQSESERLTGNFQAFVKALKAKHKATAKSGPDKAEPKPKAGELQALEGRFTGIQQGDYAHWEMTAKNGTPRSFFILKPDKSVEAVVESPEKFVGKACRIQWKATKETLPEAGGAMMLDQMVSVEWVK